ncbi:MAG: MOSC domain-containing protein [Betaproteobacteria bacterium]|nr:MOSC domain-containing protein [Betaproteobacteria bacterium]
MITLRQLVTHFGRPGKVETLLLRPGRNQRAVQVDRAEALVGLGLAGDRSAAARQADPKRRRQVTLIQAEHLAAVAALLEKPVIDPADLRRNIVVSGLNLLAARSPMRDHALRLVFGRAPDADDAVVFEVTGPCEPCSAMETALGFGGYNAMRGHGGVTARVQRGGWIEAGMPVWVVEGASEPSTH